MVLDYDTVNSKKDHPLKADREAKKILEAIKEVLKLKKITYGSLATTLGVSLPTIKRWLNSTNLSVGELSRICDALDLNWADLLSFTERHQGDSFRFTLDQEVFLAKNPAFLAYLYELQTGLSPLNIEKKHHLTRSSTKRYLKNLQSLDLIKSFTLDAATLYNWKTVIWDDYGPLGQVFSKEMLKQLSHRILSQYGEKNNAFLALWGRSLTDEDYKELKEEFKQIENKYRKISDYNRKIYKSSQLNYVSIALMADFYDADIFSRIHELT
jgi:transcriptional regulator with XRE-family HTH domain